MADSAKISPEERQTQGHHRLQGTSQSVRLYGRDDVFAQLSFQSKLIKGVHEGFRFAIPQHRGSQQPVRELEPNVSTLESFNKQLPEHSWQFFDFSSETQPEVVSHPDVHQAEATSTQVDSSSDSSSDESESQSSDDDVPVSKKPRATLVNDLGFSDEALVAFASSVQHCMLSTTDSNCIQYGQGFWRTACGAALNPERVGFGHEPQSDKQLCRRKGCMKLWSKWY